jgi:two-component system sensor histidine kinase BaeS
MRPNPREKRDRYWRHHRPHRPPPWLGWEHERHHGFGDWGRPSHRKRGEFLFLRFAGIFGLVALLAVGGMAALAFVFTRLFAGGTQAAVIVWITGCSLSAALPVLSIALAVRAFSGIARPLGGVVSAAEAVANGDLSVRVPAEGYGDFYRLAAVFNHMLEELESADRQRRNLTADVAHELRTPLQVIQGNLEGILDDVYEPTEEHITATLDETRLLARLVEDLGTLSLAESGQLALVREQVDVGELLQDVQTSFSGQAETAGIELLVQVEGEPESMIITADAGRLDQVLGNLVVNALRHTRAGGRIVLGAEPTADGVRIAVEDTGEGIAPEDLPAVFDRFWKGDRSRSHASGAGSGLGLAIVRQLVRAHGGEVEVVSALGQGTIFTIELPRNAAQTQYGEGPPLL